MPSKKTPAELEEIRRLKAEIAAVEEQSRLIRELPFLHGWKFYPWAREFFETDKKIALLCAANQISKSSTQIRKVIHWATCQELWPTLWRRPPSQFWYLYPSQDVVDVEFKLKWEREFLPRGAMKDDPVYGWKEIKGEKGATKGIKFNSGVYLFFKTYSQNVSNLQTGTVDAVFCDEELPEHLVDELMMRLNATDGYFSMVFTATLGQDHWRRAMEPDASDEEVYPDAYKKTVSLYEAMFYEDGTPSHWTEERILQVKAKCKNHAEVQKRVYGKFIVVEGRIFPTYDASRHMKKPHPLPSTWLVYEGVDLGSGGENHPSAICFVAVRPDFRAARVFLGWRGDKIRTTDGDVVTKHIELKKENKLNPIAQYYDWSSKDFETLARGQGENFTKAEKSHEKGEEIINTLFKNDMMFIYESPELAKLSAELSSLKEKTPKRHRKDDFADALRYAVTLIPWDLSQIGLIASAPDESPEKPMNDKERELSERRKRFEEKEEEFRVEQEFDELNELAGS